MTDPSQTPPDDGGDEAASPPKQAAAAPPSSSAASGKPASSAASGSLPPAESAAAAGEASPAQTRSIDVGVPQTPAAESPSAMGRIAFAVQFFTSLAIVALVLWYLVGRPERPAEEQDLAAGGPEALYQAIRTVGPLRFRVDPESSIGRKLVPAAPTVANISTPIVQVPGTVAASLRPVAPGEEDQWQFNDPEALEAFYDYRLAEVDVQFNEEQAQRMRQLNDARLASHQRIVERLRRLVAAGTDTQADLQLAETEYLEAEIEGRNDIHEADSELRRSRQAMAIAARQLQLMGLDIEMVEAATAEVDVVVAEVPEEYQRHVRIGQRCEARFLGLRGQVFPGTVQRISPTLSIERRSLRVLFYVDDPDDKLRPGMFADIGLGADPRETLLVPAESVIHIGRHDYVFARDPAEPNHWHLVEVDVGEVHDGMIEVFAGLEPEREIIGAGAILLKPVAAAAIRDASGELR